MNVLKHICTYCLSGVLLLSGCNTADEPVMPQSPSTPSRSIAMSICTNGASTRALIENSDMLQQACTPIVFGGDGEAIAIWGDSIMNGAQGNIFAATPLYYDKMVGENDEVNGINWNYANEKEWAPGAQYLFRAYFPKTEVETLLTGNSDAEELHLQNFNTQTSQTDVMVAATTIDTEANPQSMNVPVPLQFRHALAGINFTVKWTANYEEKITSCYLQNISAGRGLATVGNMVYTGYNNANEDITWNTQYKVPNRLYEWRTNGVPLTTNNEVTLYTQVQGVTVATGEDFTQNNGWLLVIPQMVAANELTFYYTLQTTGNHVYAVTIPAITYEAGNLYRYNLELSGSQAIITLTIAEWNERNSTHNIEI